MVITYYEPACVKIQSGDSVFVFDPPSKESTHKSPRFQADVICVSHNHPDHNGVESISGKGDAKPIVCDGPGEYEIAGTHIYGALTSHAEGYSDTTNTVYIALIEGTRVAHLGSFGEKTIRGETRSVLGEVDILCIPIGGEESVDAKTAATIATHVEAKIVIPMNYDKKTLEQFLKDIGSKAVRPIDKLTVKAKDVVSKSGEVVVLT